MHTEVGVPDEALRQFLASESDPAIVLSPAGPDTAVEGFVFTDCNPAARARWRLGDDLDGVGLDRLIGPELVDSVVSACEQVWATGDPRDLRRAARPGEPEAVETVRIRRLGDQITLTLTSDRLEEGDSASREGERYRILAENASDLVFQSAAGGLLTWVSPSVRSLLGWTPASLVGHRFEDYVHPDDLAGPAAQATQPDTGQPVRYEGRFRHRNGTWVWLAVTSRALFDADGQLAGRVGSGRDISSRVAAEQALADSERLLRAERETLRATLDASLDPQVVLRAVRDDTGTVVDLEFADCNRAVCEYAGLARSDLVGQRLGVRFQGQTVGHVITWSTEVIETGRPLVKHGVQATSALGGADRWFDVGIVKVADGVALTWRDVTRSVEQNRAMAEGQELYELITENSPVGMCVVAPDGSFLKANAALCALLDRDAEELTGTTWPELTHPEDLPADLRLADEVLRGQRDSYQLTKRYLRPDGSIIWGLLSVACVRDSEGHVRYFIAQIVDITELAKGRQALAESEKHYRLLAEHTSDVVVTFGESGLLDWISPSVTEVFGWTPDELLGQSISSFISTYDWGQVSQELDDSSSAGADTGGAFRVRRRDGSWMWVDATASTVRTPEGESLRVARIRDVDAETRARLALERSEERFRAAMRSTPVGMALVSDDGRFLQVNHALCQMVKRTEASLAGALVTSLTHPADQGVDLEMWNALHSARTSSITREKRLLDAQGAVVWVEQALAVVTDDQGERTSFVAQFMDVTEARNARAQLDFQANHDPLTDLKNRRAVLETMSAVLAHPPRTGTELGVLFCDLDYFKAVNDRLGHQAGDELLIEVASRIRSCVRTQDTVGRIGGDEFVVLLAQVHDTADALLVAEKIRGAVSQPVRLGGAEVVPSMSIGAAVAHSGDDPDRVLARADQALYLAKEAGRGRAVAHDGADPSSDD
ncbi:MAG TPA: PAS domain S-box protein [Actinomycetota bacterium]|nr:PAS domain S-box protein [Actinomycetota bacterium]